MGTPKNMLYNALIAIGWLIILSSIASDMFSMSGMLKLINEQDAWNYPEVRETIAYFVTGIFQGLGLGILCLFAAHQIKPFRGSK